MTEAEARESMAEAVGRPPSEEIAKAAELARRLGAHNVEALLLVTDQTRRKHTLELDVGVRPDQVQMVVVTRWSVKKA